MEYISGRDNLAVTIYVPYDCPNNCPFCTSKKMYDEKKGSLYNICTAIGRLSNYYVPYKEVVITGGEPTANIELLRKMVSYIPNGKRIFINTTVLSKTYDEFVAYLLSPAGRRISGVNISRHAASYDEELNTLAHIVTDEQIEFLAKIIPIRINCVLTPDTDKDAIISRWHGKNVEVSFRADFTTIHTDEELHSPYDKHATELANKYKYIGHTGCNVCDTLLFKNKNMSIRYHRGKEHTLITNNQEIEFNDIIIFPNGTISLDWDDNEENQNHAKNMMEHYYQYSWNRPSVSYDMSTFHGCGGSSSCGGYHVYYTSCGGTSGCGG